MTMPGPNSAPNGDKTLTTDPAKRRALAAAGKLRTGKTAASK
jgi:hypothetical protein